MNRNNLIMSSLRDFEEQNVQTIPPGYIPVNLSTKGKLGAPKEFHIRNFKMKDIMALSLTEQNDLPERIVQVLNDMILEDVDVANWHEKEVEETLVYVYMTFFDPVIRNVPFIVTDEDKKYLIENNQLDVLSDLESGKWKPTTDIDMLNGVDTYDISDDFNSKITITNKKTKFFVTFDYVKYGDQITIKKWINSYFKEKESTFDRYKKTVEFNNSLLSKVTVDPSVIDKVIKIDQEDEHNYNEFVSEKLQVLTDIVKIISIVNYNGQDVSNMSLSEKYELMSNDARIDVGMINKLTARQSKYKFGIKPDVKMKNPITKGVSSRPFTFRLPVIISAIQVSGDSEYDDGYDDED